MDKIECYIEEYYDDTGRICARLREKKSNKQVVIYGDYYDKLQLLRFLSAAKQNAHIMPTVFNRNGSDIVAVRGNKVKEDSKAIEVMFDEVGAGYLFE